MLATLQSLGEVNSKTLYFSEATTFLDIKLFSASNPFSAYLFVRNDWSDLNLVDASGELGVICKNAAFVGFWGKDSERFHDLADEILVADHPNSETAPIPTSWEDEDTLDEELWHFVYSYKVDDPLVSKCLSWIIVSLDQNISFDDVARIVELLKQENIA